MMNRAMAMAAVLVALTCWGSLFAQEDANTLRQRLEATRSEREKLKQDNEQRYFSTALLTLTDRQLSQAETALQQNRLDEAALALHRAQWYMPALPPQWPEHIERIFGQSKMMHAGEVNDGVGLPDGKTFITASSDQTIVFWDLPSGKAIKVLRGHQGAVRCLALRPDGKELASGGSDAQVILWDLATGTIRKKLAEGHSGYLTSLAYSPDGTKLVSSGANQELFLWDLSKEASPTRVRGVNALIYAAAFRPDGNQFATASADGMLQFWSLRGSQAKQPISLRLPLYALAYSPDGETLAVAGDLRGEAPRSSQIVLFSATTSEVRFRLSGHNGGIRSLCFSSDSKKLASGGSKQDPSVIVWDMETKLPLRSYQGHVDEVRGVFFSKDQQFVYSVSCDQSIRVWDRRQLRPPTDLIGHEAPIWSLAISHDGRQLASASADRTVKLWNTATRQVEHTLSGHAAPVTVVQFRKDGKQLASGGGDKAIRLWDAATGQEEGKLEGHTAPITALVYSPGGNRILSGSADRSVKIWSLESNKVEMNLGNLATVVTSVAWSSDGTMVAAGGGDSKVQIWDAEKGKALASITAMGSPVSAMAWFDTTLAVATADGQILLVHSKTMETRRTLLGHQGPISTLAFSSAGRFLLSGGSDKSVRIWDVLSGTEIRALRGHEDWVTAAIFSPDGLRAYSAGVDRLIKLWEIGSTDWQPRYGHTRAVQFVTTSPKGDLVASASDEAAIRIWQVATGNEIMTLPGHADGVIALAFSPEGDQLLSTGRDARFKLWDLKTGKEIRAFAAPPRTYRVLRVFDQGKRALSWGDRQIHVWDINSGKQTQSMKLFDQQCACMALSEDGQMIVAALNNEIGWISIKEEKPWTPVMVEDANIMDVAVSPDHKEIYMAAIMEKNVKILVWDIAAAKVSRSWVAHSEPSDGFVGITLDASGKKLMSYTSDRSVKCWHVSSGKMMRDWKMDQPIDHLDFLPDSKHAVTANGNGTLYLLTLPNE